MKKLICFLKTRALGIFQACCGSQTRAPGFSKTCCGSQTRAPSCCGLLLLAALLVLTIGRATPTSLTPVTLTNATNTVTGIPAYLYNQPLQNAVISHGAVGVQTNGVATNQLFVNIYCNAPNTTTTNGRVLLGTWWPQTNSFNGAQGNAATETILGANYPVTNNLSFDICTSNTVSGLTGTYGN